MQIQQLLQMLLESIYLVACFDSKTMTLLRLELCVCIRANRDDVAVATSRPRKRNSVSQACSHQILPTN